MSEHARLYARQALAEPRTGKGEGSDATEKVLLTRARHALGVYVTLASGSRVVAVAPPEPAVKPGEAVSIAVRANAVHFFDAETGTRISR